MSRLIAERECIWELGVKLERMDPARRPLPSQAEDVAELHATAFQKVLDMPSLPNSFRKQVADLQFCSRIFANGVLPIAWLTFRFWHVLLSPTTLTTGNRVGCMSIAVSPHTANCMAGPQTPKAKLERNTTHAQKGGGLQCPFHARLG